MKLWASAPRRALGGCLLCLMGNPPLPFGIDWTEPTQTWNSKTAYGVV